MIGVDVIRQPVGIIPLVGTSELGSRGRLSRGGGGRSRYL